MVSCVVCVSVCVHACVECMCVCNVCRGCHTIFLTGGAEIIGNPKSKMVSFGPGNPSRASFNNIALKPREYIVCSIVVCLMWFP